jgi:hypothetical protein
MSEWAIIIAAISLEVVILTSAVGIVWKLSRIELALRSDFTEKHTLLAAHFADKHSSISADFTEKHALLAAKVYQIEIWARDEFVRKGSFDTVVARLEKTMELMATKIETAVDKMASRIENIGRDHHA